MAGLIRNHPRKFMAGGVLATGKLPIRISSPMDSFCLADLLRGALVFSDYLPNPMRTTGVANIEKRYSSGGASPSHTPGSATPRGKIDQVTGNQEKSKGIGTPHYEENIGDQKKQAGGGGGSNVWIHFLCSDCVHRVFACATST